MSSGWSSRLSGADLGGARFGPWSPGAVPGGNDLRRIHKWLVIAGIFALITGLVAIAVPVIASVTTAIFIGWLLVASGLTIAIHAVPRRSLLSAVEALLSLIAGLYVLVFPLSGTVTLTFVLAVWFFASGVLSLALAAQWRAIPGAWIQALGGVLSVVLGFLIAANLPSSAAWAIGLLVGINLIFWGVRALIGARLIREMTGR